MTIPRPRQTIIYTVSEETVLIPWQGGPAQLLNELLWNTSRVILPLASCHVAICYAYFTVTYIDFTLSYGFLYSIHARFKTIYIDLMLFYSFFSSCYAYFTVTNVDFTLSCGFLSSIHACFKTIYIDVMPVLQLLVKILCMLQNDIFIDVILFYGFWSSQYHTDGTSPRGKALPGRKASRSKSQQCFQEDPDCKIR